MSAGAFVRMGLWAAAICAVWAGGAVRGEERVYFFGQELRKEEPPCRVLLGWEPGSESGRTLFGIPLGAIEYTSNPARRMRELLNQSEDLRRIEDEWEEFWRINHPSQLRYDRIDGSIE
jgi:hypothetical protein